MTDKKDAAVYGAFRNEVIKDSAHVTGGEFFNKTIKPMMVDQMANVKSSPEYVKSLEEEIKMLKGDKTIPQQYPQSVGCPYPIKEPLVYQEARETRETLGLVIPVADYSGPDYNSDFCPDTVITHTKLTVKDTNPKDACGTAKVPMSTVSGPVILEVGLAMMEGARKYGRHNYRVAGVRASVYYDAAMRHLIAWYEGQDTDPDSGMSHVAKAMASLAVLRDAQINNKCVDDRPPKCNEDFVKRMNQMAGELLKKYPDAPDAYTEKHSDK